MTMTSAKRKRFRWQNALLYGLLFLVLAGLVFPVLFMAFTSLKTPGEVNRIPPTLWPRYPTLENYPFMADAWDFWLALRNSVLLAGGSGLAATLLGAMAAYAFSRGTFRGKTLMYSLLVASMAVPAMVTLGPIFIAYLQLNLLDTHIGLILVFTAGGLPLAVLLQFAYFNAIPRELDDAAAIDGAGRFTTLFRIIMPIAMPGVFVSFLLLFIGGWNEFLFVFTLSTSPNTQVLTTNLYTIPPRAADYQSSNLDLVATAGMLVLLPLAPLLMLTQRQLVEGITFGAVQG